MKKSLKLSFLIAGFSSLSVLPVAAISCNKEQPNNVDDNHKTEDKKDKETENINKNDQKAEESKQDSNANTENKTEETNKNDDSSNTDTGTNDKKDENQGTDQGGSSSNQPEGSTNGNEGSTGGDANQNTPEKQPDSGANQGQDSNAGEVDKPKNSANEYNTKENIKTNFMLKLIEHVNNSLEEKMNTRLDANYNEFKTDFIEPNKASLQSNDPIYQKETFDVEKVKAKLLEVNSSLESNNDFNNNLYYISVSQEFKKYSEKLIELYQAVEVLDYPLSFEDKTQVSTLLTKVQEVLNQDKFTALKEFVKLASQKPAPSNYFFIDDLTKEIVSKFVAKQNA
ncbi:hypothetical protein AB5V95_03010 [Metamycoplasma spumans]|uniref:hypothetical protein n=1 Tax=Metamycoplasma spumans TaxID=92406 RepID=UPI0034DCD7CB